MARKTRQAAKYLKSREVPERIVRPEQLRRASDESDETFSQVLNNVSTLLQAGSGLGPFPAMRRMIERGYLKA